MATEDEELLDDEGPRAFARVIEQLGEGDAHMELSEAMHELVKACITHARATRDVARGKLQLTLSVAVEHKGVAGITYDVKVTEPKPRRSGGVFWVTKGGNLTVENPRQTKLPLKEVGGPDSARDVDDEQEEARSV